MKKNLAEICRIEKRHFILDCCPVEELTENPVVSEGDVKKEYDVLKEDKIMGERGRHTFYINEGFLHGFFDAGRSKEPLVVRCNVCGAVYEITPEFYYSMYDCFVNKERREEK